MRIAKLDKVTVNNSLKRSRLPTSFRWIDAIGSFPQGPATGDSAGSHRAPERGRQGADAPSGPDCVRHWEGEVI